MIIGIGTDIFCVDRMRRITSAGDPFFRRAFTNAERAQAISRSDPILYFATHFAGKEAVYKAISQCGCDFRPQEIEIVDSDNGYPLVNIHGNTKIAMGSESEFQVFVSLSNDGVYAIAYALAERMEKGKSV